MYNVQVPVYRTQKTHLPILILEKQIPDGEICDKFPLGTTYFPLVLQFSEMAAQCSVLLRSFEVF